MCEGLLLMSTISDVISGDVIISRARSLTSLFADTSLLSVRALHNCTSALTRSVISESELLSTDEVGVSILQSLSKVSRLESLLPLTIMQDVSDAMNALAASRLSEQVVGSELTFLLSGSIRMSSLKLYYSPTAGSSIYSPRTSYEYLIGNQFSTSVQFDSSAAEDNSEFGMSVSENLNNFENTQSSPVSITSGFDDSTTDRRLLGSNMQLSVELLNYNFVNYTSSVSSKVNSFGCVKRNDKLPYNLTISCTSDIGVITRYKALCPGNKKGSIFYSCPEYLIYPQCVTFNGTAFEDDASCTVSKYNSTHVTCVCGGMGSTSRWLQSSSSSYQTLTLATSTKSYVTKFDSTFSFIQEVQPESLDTVPLLFGCMVTVIVLVLISSQVAHLYNQKSKSKRRKQDYTVQENDVFSEVLPVELTELNWKQRFLDKLVEISILGGVLFSRRDKFRSVAKGMILVLTVMFVDIMLAWFFFNDDGSCRLYTNEDSCVDIRTYSFGYGHHTCHWNDVERWCTFNQTHDDFMSALLLTVVVLFCAIPIVHFLFVLVDVIYASMEVRVKYPNMKSFSKVYVDSFMERSSSKARMDVFLDDWEKRCGDERRSSWQPMVAKVVISGRIDVMRRRMDELDVDDEVCLMGLTNKHPFIFPDDDENTFLSCLLDDRSMPPGGIDIQGSFAAATREIVKARTRSLDINNEMETVLGDHAKELMLFRNFLMFSLPPHKRQFSKRFICSSGLNRDSTIPVRWTVNFSFWFLLFYLTTISSVIVYVGFALDASSVKIWGKVAAFAILEYVFLLDTCFVFFLYIFSVAFIRTDVLRMYTRLRDKGKFIMTRRMVGAMRKERCSAIHHFNPACRVARMRPKYLISRLLIQLNDFDIPATYASRPKYSSTVYTYGVMSLFLILAFFPDCVSDLIVYYIFVGLFGSLFGGTYYLLVYNTILAVFFVAFLILVLVGIFYFMEQENEINNYTPSKLRMVLNRMFPCKRKSLCRRKFQHYEVSSKNTGGSLSPSAGDSSRRLQSTLSSSALVVPSITHHVSRASSMGTPQLNTAGAGDSMRTEQDVQRLKDELVQFQNQLRSLKKQNSSLK
jgi:hypothetical protein